MAIPDEAIDIDYLREWIGCEDVTTDAVTTDLVRKFHATLDLPGEPAAEGSPAPALVHYCLAPPVISTAALGIDGHPQRGGFLPPIPLPRRMWAGSGLNFIRPILVGDLVRRVSRISDVAVKQGRSGTLAFVTVEHVLDVAGDISIQETQDIVYRGLGDAGTPIPMAASAPVSSHQRVVLPSAALLFRYSALTFNGHRIHYDRSYAIDEEGYPGLVVHGPMQATMLLHHAIATRGMTPANYAFRSQAPLFDTAPMRLEAVEEGARTILWTARPDGPVAMRAEVGWS